MNAGQPKLSVKERDGPPQFIGVFAHLPVLLPPERRDESHFNRQKLEIQDVQRVSERVEDNRKRIDEIYSILEFPKIINSQF